MDSLINGIIDCVARPSTTDSPIRVIRKTDSESPLCVSSDPGMDSFTESAHRVAAADSDSESSSTHTIPSPPNHMRGLSSSSSLSRLMVSGDATPINSVLTAEGIIMGDERGFVCGPFGDCTTCYEDNGGDDGTVSSETMEPAVVRQFEAAFATFLYKNPAFTSMSHTNIQKLRAKLSKESAKNARMDKELRRQLAGLREAKRNRELELQQELLVVTRAKAKRQAELLIQIQKTRRSSMLLDQTIKTNGNSSPTVSVNATPAPSSPVARPWFDIAFGPSSHTPTTSAPAPLISGSDSFEEFQKEIQRNKMEQAYILAEIEKIKMQIVEEKVNVTP